MSHGSSRVSAGGSTTATSGICSGGPPACSESDEQPESETVRKTSIPMETSTLRIFSPPTIQPAKTLSAARVLKIAETVLKTRPGVSNTDHFCLVRLSVPGVESHLPNIFLIARCTCQFLSDTNRLNQNQSSGPLTLLRDLMAQFRTSSSAQKA